MKDILKYHKEKDEYSESEIEKISIYILGLHMKSKYKILCEECHTQIHKKYFKRRTKDVNGFELVKSRRFSKGESNAQRIVFWIEHRNDGEIFSVQEMLHDLNLTNEQLKTLVINNNSLRNMLEKRYIELTMYNVEDIL